MVSHQSSRKVELAEIHQPLQMDQTGVGDVGSGEVQFVQTRECSQGLEALVGQFRLGQAEDSQVVQVAEAFQAGTRDRGFVEKQQLKLGQPRQTSESDVGDLRPIKVDFV